MSELPNVLLLGDSQRGRYMPVVRELLAGQANVLGPAENCCHALYTAMRLPAWLRELGQPRLDLVHWNNGLHDVGHCMFRGPEQFALPHYLKNLEQVLSLLRKAGARKIIWATTNPVHPRRSDRRSETDWWWSNRQIDRYNAAAEKFMRRRGLAINDLHALVAADPDRMIEQDLLHLSPHGAQVCAKAVAEAVRRELDQPPA